MRQGTGLLVVGLGSVHRGDDGIGVRLVEAVRKGLGDGIETAIWGDCDALTIAHELMERSQPVLFVDCATMGAEPGEWRVFDETSVLFRQSFQSISTHGYGLDYALQLARNLGYGQPVRFFGIQPEECHLGDTLSAGLAGRFSSLMRELSETAHVLSRELVGNGQG